MCVADASRYLRFHTLEDDLQVYENVHFLIKHICVNKNVLNARVLIISNKAYFQVLIIISPLIMHD